MDTDIIKWNEFLLHFVLCQFSFSFFRAVMNSSTPYKNAVVEKEPFKEKSASWSAPLLLNAACGMEINWCPDPDTTQALNCQNAPSYQSQISINDSLNNIQYASCSTLVMYKKTQKPKKKKKINSMGSILQHYQRGSMFLQEPNSKEGCYAERERTKKNTENVINYV